MNCEEAKGKIQETLDGGALDDAARRHLAGCGECAVFRERLLEVDTRLAEDPVLAWTPEMTESVVSRVRTETRSRRWLLVAAAAAVLAVAWLGVQLVPAVPGLDTVGGEIGTRVEVPATPTEAAERITDGVASLLALIRGAIPSTELSGAAPVALVALLLLLVLNGLVAGRLRLARRQS